MAKSKIGNLKKVEQKAREVLAEIPRYRMVPVDALTHQRLMKICEVRGLGQRSQGAVVRILINKEFETLEKSAASGG